jgi:protein-L-isoaspartate(D-aspartate) O-methyltransferase
VIILAIQEKREKLIQHLLDAGYLKTEKVIEAMRNVPRELFTPPDREEQAYLDSPIPTFEGQTISAPHMNAMMCELLKLEAGMNILEIGTGSGYHTALCAFIVGKISKKGTIGHVYTIERIIKLAEFAKENIKKAGIQDTVTIICGDGTLGLPEKAPFDRILVTAAGPNVPETLLNQLKMGGLLCIPIGEEHSSQRLLLITKTETGFNQETICGVIFVPLIGKFGFS